MHPRLVHVPGEEEVGASLRSARDMPRPLQEESETGLVGCSDMKTSSETRVKQGVAHFWPGGHLVDVPILRVSDVSDGGPTRPGFPQ